MSDPLEKWAGLIAVAKVVPGETACCIYDLAAALRAEREQRQTDKICIDELAANLLNQLARVSELEGLLLVEERRVAELEADARLGRMVRAAREAVLDYDMPFHQCTCCGGCHVYDVELCRFVARHTPDCAWAALVKVIKSEPEGGKHEGFDIGRDRAIGK